MCLQGQKENNLKKKLIKQFSKTFNGLLLYMYVMLVCSLSVSINIKYMKYQIINKSLARKLIEGVYILATVVEPLFGKSTAHVTGDKGNPYHSDKLNQSSPGKGDHI